MMRTQIARRLRNLSVLIGGAPDLKALIPEITDWQKAMLEAVRPYTMTDPTAQWATLQAMQHVYDRGISGDFVECGVWRGGNTMIAGLMRKRLGANFSILAFDTFTGMTPPTQFDAKPNSSLDVRGKFDKLDAGDHNEWCYASIEDVRSSFAKVVGSDDLITVKGSVMDTLADPANLPEKIAVLRLDTDFYDSTKVELEVLWPRLVPGGVLMIDDYGAWAGAKKATDDYFGENRPWLQYVNRDVRLVIKPDR